MGYHTFFYNTSFLGKIWHTLDFVKTSTHYFRSQDQYYLRKYHFFFSPKIPLNSNIFPYFSPSVSENSCTPSRPVVSMALVATDLLYAPWKTTTNRSTAYIETRASRCNGGPIESPLKTLFYHHRYIILKGLKGLSNQAPLWQSFEQLMGDFQAYNLLSGTFVVPSGKFVQTMCTKRLTPLCIMVGKLRSF